MPVAPVSANTIGDTAVVAAVTGKKIRVKSLVLSNQTATAQSVKFRNGTTDLHGAIPLPLVIGGQIRLAGPPEQDEDFLFETSPGNALQINLSAATAITGAVVYSLD